MTFSRSSTRENLLERNHCPILTSRNSYPHAAVVPYSAWSQDSVINQLVEYKDSHSFTPLIDMFYKQSLASARIILSQFKAVNNSDYSE